jgi:hypothetical protein
VTNLGTHPAPGKAPVGGCGQVAVRRAWGRCPAVDHGLVTEPQQDPDPDLAEVARRERQLLDPALRADDGRAGDLLHPDFREHGASGRVWDRTAMLAAMSADPSVASPASEVEATRLSADVVLVTYRITGPAGSLRSSVWVRDDVHGWRVRFHQGTRAPDAGRGD